MGDRGSQALATGGGLTPFLPRVCIDWLRTSPQARHRRLDGTLVLVDISGFTEMSELLAPFGALGAEEVTEAMSRTFASLLSVAYAHGGGLVKFGGDALLLLFDGEHHLEHGVAAALGMRSTLAGIGTLQTSAGTVQLRMHAGINTGSFDFFFVGETHRELIVSGPAAAVTVEMEEAAQAGEIAVSSTAAGLLDPALLGASAGPGVLVAAPPDVRPTGVTPLPDASGLDLSIGIPAALRADLLTETLESEHRHAAVAFVRFGGVAPLLETDTHAAVDAVDEVVATIQSAADAHGVCFLESDIDVAGGRIILVAGAPTTHGDDEERLLRTVRAATDARTRLPLHIGVASGNVFAGRIGPPYRQTFTILGGTAALAARLMARAPERAVWATAETLARSRTTFTTTALPPLALKGKSKPVEAAEVGAIEGARRAAASLPLVDRQRELPVLEASLVPVKLGFGSFVELVGPAGIGKSRILEEVSARAELPIVSSACEQYQSTTPYSAFRRLVAGVLGITESSTAEVNARILSERMAAIDEALRPWAPLVADVLDMPVLSTSEVDDLQPAFRRARLHGIVETLLATSYAEPTLFVFEDTHWMDEASSELLRHLGSQVSTKPWLICATRRPVGGGFAAAAGTPPIPALTLQLDPIPEADAKELARSAGADGLDPAELDAIIERAAGNPLFVRELAATLQGGGADALPESVEEVVTVRIDSLPAADRALLRWASVLGVTFSGALVPSVLEGDPDAVLDDESWNRLAEFVERDPYNAGQFRFRHALIRDAAYNGLSFRRRRELHARVAEVARAQAVDEQEVAETLSLHYQLAELPEPTWRYSLIAAERARAKFANVDAAEFYRRAIAVAKRLPSLAESELASAWEGLGDVLERTGDYREARRAYRSARVHAGGDADALTALALKEGRLRENAGHYAQALRWYERGLRELAAVSESARGTHRVRLSLGYAGARFRQGMVDDCIEWAERAADEARTIGALPELAHAYHLLHLAYTSVGSPKRFEARGRALPIYEELGDLLGQADTLNNLGIDAYYEGRWPEALAYYERSGDARRRIGDVVGAAIAENNIAEILSDQGYLADAIERFERVRETCRAAGSRLMTAVATSNLGRAAARQGRADDARELLAEAVTALKEIDAGSFVVETLGRIAEAALLRLDSDRALEVVAETEASTAGVPPAVQALLHRVRGEALALRGDRERAVQELGLSLDVARGVDAKFETAVSLASRGRLTGDAADRADAQAIFDGLGVVTPT